MKSTTKQQITNQAKVYDFPIPDSACIIQPYVFPYIGYFQLLYSVENVVFYDDVNFIKKGWINRNRILMNQSDYLFTVPLIKASQNKLIYEVEVMDQPSFQKKFCQQLKFAYSKAPFYKEVSKLVESALDTRYSNISDVAIESILSVCKYLEIDLKWMKSSNDFHDSQGQQRADRLINITKKLGCDTYINPIGGRELYQKEHFKNSGIELGFIQTQVIEYKQFESKFVPYLSIIDLLMFNDRNTAKELLFKFDIV